MKELIPTPPTDNLYKFWGLAGLIIAILSVFWPFSMLTDLSTKIFDTRLEVQKLEIVVASTRSKVDEYREKAVLLRARSSNSPPDATTVDELIKEGSDLEHAATELRIRLAELSSASAKIEFLGSISDMAIRFMWIGGSGGIVIMFWGFGFWYTRVQVFQDKILKREADGK